MKFTPEVIAAIETLRNAADNDFELHCIDVLERDLTAPPQVEVIDDTHQRFNGVIYYMQHNGKHFHKDFFLHRVVWAYYNGELPDGYDVHHIDTNSANNTPENLKIMTRAEHRRLHGLCRLISPLERICPACGKTFIRRDTKSKYCSSECFFNARTFPKQEKTCLVCGKTFVVPTNNPEQKYCSMDCANKAKTFHNRNKICPVCGKSFVAPSIKPNQIYCSRDCAYKGRMSPRIEKICPVCGKKFQVNQNRKRQQTCCSRECGIKWREQHRHLNEQ